MTTVTVLDRPLAATTAMTGVVPRDTRRARQWEIIFLAILVTYLYALLGWWLKYDYHFWIADALKRTTEAKDILFSRDPHAAAIGIYWMPLPTVVQLPLVAILEPLRHPEFAGPLSTAMFGGGTVLVLGRLCRDVGLPRITGFFVALAYAVNPVVAYYAANGMSESAEFFFIALALWGLLRFLRDDRNGSAVIAATGLAGLALTKDEAAPIVGLAALVLLLVHIRRLSKGQWHESALNAAIIVLPAVFGVVTWLIYQKLIVGSFFAFLHSGPGEAGGKPPADVLAALGSVPRTLRFVAHWIFVFFPAAALVVPALLLPPWRRTLAGFVVIATGVLAVATTGFFVYSGHTVGEPRYFTPVIIVGAIALVVIAGRLRRRNLAHALIDPAIVLILIISGYTGALAETSKGVSLEGEARVFNIINGVYDDRAPDYDIALKQRATARELDKLLQPGDRVLIDGRNDRFAIALYSRKADQIVTTYDRDYEQLVSPTGLEARIGWAVVPRALPNGAFGLSPGADDAYQLVHRQAGWHEVWHQGLEGIWKRDSSYLKGLPMPPRG